MAKKKLKIKLVKSPIGAIGKHQKIVKSMGFRKLNQVIERPDNDSIRGMIKHIKHMVEIVGE
jgi:large subunit ribosomal protein L30